jgi:hypothetical protein
VHAIMRKPFDINQLADVVESAASGGRRGEKTAGTAGGNVVIFPSAEER